MAKAREIKKRMKAVGNIKRITKTMQMIATGKFAKSQQRAMATKPYTEGVFELVTELAAKAGNVSHPLIEGPAGGSKGPHLVLTLTSDRGLCGAYNGSVLRAAVAHMREQKGKGLELVREIVGKKGAAFFRFNQYEVSATHTFGDTPRFEDVERVAEDYMKRFIAGEIASVRVVYMRFISVARQRPEVLQLLPLKPPVVEDAEPVAGGSQVDYEFSPSPEELLNDLLPVTVKTTLFQAVNDAVVSEQIARMVAMKAATDNAGKMGKALGRKYNRARQAQITTELTEIISGAAALE